MLGELIVEEKGKITGRRVVPSKGGASRVEVSFQANGKILGIEHRVLVTYWSVVQPNGFLYGEGQGVVMTKDGDQATFLGQGTGKFKPGGGVSYRGAVYYQTASPKLARLNGIAAVFEYETDANDNTSAKSWEWK